MQNLSRRQFINLSMSSGFLIFPGINCSKKSSSVKVGYHLWNCSREWDTDFDECLKIVKKTGWSSFEALLEKTKVSAKEFREKTKLAGLICTAISGPVKEVIDFSFQAGVHIVRVSFPKEEIQRWVAHASERDIKIVIHNHIGRGGQGTGAVETRDDLLRYMDERPGIYACPDTGHLLLCGDDPVQTMYDLGDRLAHVHLKDVNPEAVGKGQKMPGMWFELGTGALDVKGVMETLEKMKFNGWVIVEYGNQVDDFYQSARNMRQVLLALGY
jgi:sugar phosphate isomerase/epimerase